MCGPLDCTQLSTFTVPIFSSVSDGQTSTGASTITSAYVSSQISPSRTSVLSTVVSGTETASRVTTTVFATGGNGLTAGQIGGGQCRSSRGIPLAGGGWVVHCAAPSQNLSFHGQVRYPSQGDCEGKRREWRYKRRRRNNSRQRKCRHWASSYRTVTTREATAAGGMGKARKPWTRADWEL